MKVPFLDLNKINKRHSAAFIDSLQNLTENGYFIGGEHVARFEEDFSAYTGVKYCVGVASGLDALILILRAYRELGYLKKGDEVIVPSNTFIATVLAISQNELVPKFVEPDPHTYNLKPEEVAQNISPLTRAIIPVHLYGQLCDIDALTSLAKENNLLIIEDAAQAHGASYRNQRAGSFGQAAAFSFYPGKNLGALGDGGAVTTKDATLAACVRSLANYGSEVKYKHVYQGFNSRLDSLQAKFLSEKLSYLDEDNARRREIADYYCQHIVNPRIKLPQGQGLAHVWHLFVVSTPQRDKLKNYLAEKGVDTVIHYPIPPHKQQAYAEYNSLSYPIAEQMAQQVLSLPISPVMTESEIHYVVEQVNNYE